MDLECLPGFEGGGKIRVTERPASTTGLNHRHRQGSITDGVQRHRLHTLAAHHTEVDTVVAELSKGNTVWWRHEAGICREFSSVWSRLIPRCVVLQRGHVKL